MSAKFYILQGHQQKCCIFEGNFLLKNTAHGQFVTYFMSELAVFVSLNPVLALNWLSEKLEARPK